ncbi:4'-phosphopantetheinyl transferase family protein [Streptomyces sp. SP18CS02]|uniref:4'-phosphopantetheinyl transferase family protein n=1 Tax=Streptomyces sp. SP18CS02 TaxID=3002531 RepID=UPI002E79E04B|nr:hypothetical protein [Streptomyces sp. SP18CS02]MEE1753802.1 hypothetical protein [Streptomyces sp. SP18CS02]
MSPREQAARILVLTCDWQEYRAPEELLGDDERALAAALPDTGRRQEWVRARLTAKAAVRLLGRLDAVQVLPASDGAPRIRAGSARLPLSVSLSHTGPVAVCAVAPGRAGLGVDAEPVDAANDVLLRRVAAPGEDALVPHGRPGLRATTLISCKEAAVKAYRRTSVRLRDYRVTRDADGGLWVRPDGGLLPRMRLWCESTPAMVTVVCAPAGGRTVRHRLPPHRIVRCLADPVPRAAALAAAAPLSSRLP